MEALPIIASESAEPLDLAAALDALCPDLELQCVRQGHDCLDDDSITAIGAKAVYKGANLSLLRLQVAA